jgi:DNA-binding MarR family transcriptional regulator
MVNVDTLMIGALLNIPWETILERVDAAHAAAGLHELRPAHLQVFQHLRPEGDRVVDLAARAGVTKQAMGYLVAALEETGYVERIADPRDGRAQIVRRTAKGRLVNEIASRTVQEVQQEWTAHLGEEDMAELLRLLRQVVRLILANRANTRPMPQHTQPWPGQDELDT